jgi:hypothetical protein
VAGSDSEHIWATSSGLVYFFDGSKWNKQGAGSGAQLSGIEVSGTGDGWAVGKSGTIVSRSGEAWAEEDSCTSVDLFAVAASRDVVWVTGANGTILRSER